MKKTINKLAIIIALALLIVGILMVIFDITLIKTEAYCLCSVGCSIIASGLILLTTSIFLDIKKEFEVWDEWKLEKIFKTRAEKNAESDPKLETHNIRQLDGIAFGLKSFRSRRKDDILLCLQKGMNMRLIVMNPDSPFVKQREKEEDEVENSIKQSIVDLIGWCKELNQKSSKGKIKIKLYNSMTLDFYWRMDDELYIGPYLLGSQSQQTITYKFKKGGRGFNYYTDYFDELWNNTDYCIDAPMD